MRFDAWVCLRKALAVCLLAAATHVAAQSAAPTPKIQPTAECLAKKDGLERVGCSKTLRVGVRSNYPPYAYKDGEQLKGFEIDLARQLAQAIGAEAAFIVVTPANRIALLGEGRIDMALATMGHTVQRDSEARFIRPQYYRSQTVVLGRKELGPKSLENLRGNTICVTVGNNTNAELSERGARLMLFDSAPRLLDELRLGGCSLVAQDDSFFATHLQKAEFAALYDTKFGFAPLPWGAAVVKDGGDNLQRALSVAMQKLHANGALEQLAGIHQIDTSFLVEQRKLFSMGACQASPATAACLLPPRNNQLQPTSFAPAVAAFEKKVVESTGVKITLAMLKSEVALKLFAQGIAFSLALVAGTVLATLVFSMLLAQALTSQHAGVRWPAHGLVRVMQSTPTILLMILAGVLITAFGANTAWVALVAAVAMLGLANGSNAGQAVAEMLVHMRAESAHPVHIGDAMHRSSAQLVAFVVNATRASPAASVIGVPELLSALTDISSFSSERITTYTLLLVFYMLVIASVVMLGNLWLKREAQKKIQEGVEHV